VLDPDLLIKVDKDKLPRHVAIVMDGNGRWAQQRLLPRNAGHRAGVTAVDAVVTTARKLGIPCLTLYALSTENWSRPRREIRALMQILRLYLRRELQRMLREKWHPPGILIVSPTRALANDLFRRLEGPLAALRVPLARKTGARGLRSILEQILLDTMYELPTLENVSKVVVDESMVSADGKPLLIYSDSQKVAGGAG